jgi:hypothetical protein
MPSFLRNPTMPIPPSKASRLREAIACTASASVVLQLASKFFSKFDPNLIDLETLAPFIPDSAYQSAIVYSYLARETREQRYSDAVAVLRRSLEVFDRRWKVAGEWLLSCRGVEMEPWFADVVIIGAYIKMLDEQQSRW